MRIMLTGGTGYLGSHLTKRFVNDGHEVLLIKRSTSTTPTLEDVKSRVYYADSDRSDMNSRIYAFSPEVVVHTAGLYENSNNTMEQLFEANFLFPRRLLQISFEAGTRTWINTSTALPPFINSYSLTKHQFSDWGKFYATKRNITFYNLQLEYMYGLNMPNHQFLSWVISKLKLNEPLELTDGLQKRDFVYINDLEDIYSGLLYMNYTGYLDIPIATGNAPSVKEVVEYLKEILNSSSELQFGVVPKRKDEYSSNLDSTLLNSLGLECKWSWKDGMKEII